MVGGGERCTVERIKKTRKYAAITRAHERTRTGSGIRNAGSTLDWPAVRKERKGNRSRRTANGRARSAHVTLFSFVSCAKTGGAARRSRVGDRPVARSAIPIPFRYSRRSVRCALALAFPFILQSLFGSVGSFYSSRPSSPATTCRVRYRVVPYSSSRSGVAEQFVLLLKQ